MAQFGDVLRGLGSVLNPQVAQEVAQEDKMRQGNEQQVGMLLLQKKIQEQSPDYQAKLEALNNEKAFRQAASESGGDPVKIASAAMQFGKPELAISMYNQQETRAARLEQAKQAHDLKERELIQRSEDKSADRASRELAQQQLFELKQQGLALQTEVARSNQDLKKMQFTMKADQGLQRSVQQLGTALEKSGLPESDSVLGAVEDALKKTNVSEYISGPKSLIPDFALPTDIAAGKQAFHKLFNITLKNRSGSAVTNQELDRLKKEYATGAFKTPAQLEKAVEQARNIINKHYASVTAGFGPDALKAYNENIRGLGGRVVLEPDSSGWKVEEVQ